MNREGGLQVDIDGATARAPGFLRMGGHADADVPFHPGEELPFEDRGVGVITCGGFVHELDRAAKLHFLLECRRTLKPGGWIGIAARAATESNSGDLSRLAMMAGLEVAPGGFTKRHRRLRTDPLVSILIPAYNARFFPACLDSALAQTYDNIEIVICDDSPGREIEAIARARASRFPVRYEPNAARLRPRGNFTRCFERARGEFVKFLCDDDLLAPDCVAALLDAFRRAPDITLATSRRRRIDAHGQDLGDQPATAPIVAEDAVLAGHTLANAMIMAGLNIVGEPTTALFRKIDLLDQAPEYFRFDGEAGHGIIDMVTWAALLLKGDAVYLCERLSSFRNHAGQRQRDPAKAQRNVESIRRLHAAWRDLKLHERLRPDVLLTKPYPPQRGMEWRAQPLLGFAAPARCGRLSADP
ncbi:MAG TPA: glycosyltransferase [Casimicrobiaceae bacterium]|nr:glycosyltransferase [Casimicrobiaceae bacterium]